LPNPKYAIGENGREEEGKGEKENERKRKKREVGEKEGIRVDRGNCLLVLRRMDAPAYKQQQPF